MVKLPNLVDIANNAKTDAQKNAVGEEVKKLLRGKKACSPKQELFSNNLERARGADAGCAVPGARTARGADARLLRSPLAVDAGPTLEAVADPCAGRRRCGHDATRGGSVAGRGALSRCA